MKEDRIMLDSKEIDRRLNLKPFPNTFHDMDMIDLKIEGSTIKVRVSLTEFQDNLGILTDKTKIGIIDGEFYDTTILELINEDDIDLKLSEIIQFEMLDNNIRILLQDSYPDKYYTLTFKFKSYKWTLYKIVDNEGFYDNDYSFED